MTRNKLYNALLSASLLMQPLCAIAGITSNSNKVVVPSAGERPQLVTAFPKAGTVVSRTDNKVLNFTELELSNGIKVIMKKTDLDKDEVIVSAQCSGGASAYSRKDWANAKLFDPVVAWSGLGSLSHEELEEFLAGKNASMALSMSDTNCLVEGMSSPDDLETLFQMFHLYFTDIRVDTVTFNSLVRYLDAGMKDQGALAEKAFNDSVVNTIYHHNPRLRSMTSNDLKSVSLASIMAMAKEVTANPAAYTLTIVGNYDEDKIRGYLEKYVASLPAGAKKTVGKRIKTVAKGVVKNNFTNNADMAICSALMYWHSDKMKWNLKNITLAEVAGQILNIIYTHILPDVEKKAINVGAYGKVIHYEDGYTHTSVVAQTPMKPEQRDSVMPLLRNAVSLLAKKCDAALLENAKLKFLMLEEEKLKTNSYWFYILYDYKRYGINLYADYAKTVSMIRPQDICAFMTELLKAGNRIEVCMSPSKR